MWFQLKIEHCPTQDVEQISDELEQMGALSIMLTDKNDNPVLEPEPGTTPLWPEVIITVLYDQLIAAQEAQQKLLLSRPNLSCSIEELPNQDWERVGMDEFKPKKFGDRLWICPTWHTPPEPNAVNLMLDPGLAFGTGAHPTTSLCLTWLEQANLTNKSVIDYGCGSGILSLAALKLGAGEVCAVDIDAQALLATQNNAAMNEVDTKQLLISQPESLNKKADVLVANILLAPLIELKSRFHQLLHPGGQLVVSGLLSEQAQDLVQSYLPAFSLQSMDQLDGWALLIFCPK